MTYYQYLRLMWRMERFYDNHPDFFADLDPEKRSAMKRVFLYDYDDTHSDNTDYPKSIEEYFNHDIATNEPLQKLALAGVSDIYSASGMGEFRLSDISDKRP